MINWAAHRAKFDSTLAAARTIALVTHLRPDPDAAGSMLGLMHVLRAAGKTVFPYVDGSLPDLAWLPGRLDINSTTPIPDFDCLIVLDCASAERMGTYQMLLEKAPASLVIDHHQAMSGSESFGSVRIVESTASSTSEMVFYLAQVAPPLKISADAATCLYAGIIGDTGGFRQANTSAQSLEAAAGLVTLGANPQAISHDLQGKSLAQLQIEGLAMWGATLLEGGLALYAEVSEEMLHKVGATQADLLGDRIPSQLVSVVGPKLITILYERGPQSCKLSVRSLPPFNSNEFCAQFGGGGHIPAAGADLAMPIAEARKVVREAIAREVASRRPLLAAAAATH
jgi:phosphoesterase RecJ-like protein